MTSARDLYHKVTFSDAWTEVPCVEIFKVTFFSSHEKKKKIQINENITITVNIGMVKNNI